MKGFVPTPAATVDLMVERLFRDFPPHKDARLLDPGCGHGVFVEGVLRWCRRHNAPRPTIIGIDLDPNKLRHAKLALSRERGVSLVRGDFLAKDIGKFDYIVGNPPYVPIEELSQRERELYRALYETARGRLDLYLLFWERALQLLRPGGRLVFITPEKFSYVETARPLRRMLSRFRIEEVTFAPEDTFPGLTTYPTITTVRNTMPNGATDVHFRAGTRRDVRLPRNGDSWQSAINQSPKLVGQQTLIDIALRVSCGIATGADKVFLFDDERLPRGFARFCRPTLAGRELRLGSPLPQTRRVLAMPYDEHGRLLPLEKLGPFAAYLQRSDVQERLRARTCVQRKPWYAFHETPPLDEMLRPKLMCKDITPTPYFWVDRVGDIVPLHSTYYIVPKSSQLLEPLAHFLNSPLVQQWLRANCQRAAHGFLRVQSAVLKLLPIPDVLVRAAECQTTPEVRKSPAQYPVLTEKLQRRSETAARIGK